MANIRLHKDPLNPLKAELVKANGAFISWAMENAPWAGAVMRNGVLLEHQTDFDMSEFDEIDVIAVPQGDPLTTFLIYTAIAVGSAVVAYALMPKPEIPNGAGEVKESPNNRLNAATNTFRPRQAMPHIYGQVRAYPDFIQPSHYQYIDNKKVIDEAFLVGVGYVDVTDVKSGDTPISDYTVYQPIDTLPTFLDVRQSNEIDGQVVIPPDDSSRSAMLTGAATTDFDTLLVATGQISALDIKIGDSIDVISDPPDLVDGVGEVLSITEIGADTEIVIDGTFTSVDPSFSGTITKFASGDASEYTVLSGDNVTEVWYHVVMPQGISSDTGGVLDIDLTIRAQRIDALGNVLNSYSKAVQISGNTPNAQYRTFKLTSAEDGLVAGRYRASIVRNTPKQPSPAIDRVQIESIASASVIDTSLYGDVTILSSSRVATENALSSRSPKTNCIAQTLLPIFDPNTGTFGARAATRSAAQTVIDVLVDKGGESLDNIDYESLFEAVPSGELGYFDFTFDDKDVSVEQAVKTILNAARCYHYMVGNVWTFERDEAKPVRSALFNVRNTLPESVQQTYSFYRNQDFDSVEIRYVNPVDNSEAYVRRRINADTGAIEDGLGDYVNEIDLAGCRNATQAVNRAELEIRKIKYLWLNATATVTSEGLLVGLGQRVGLVSINKTKVFAGEVLEDLGGGVYRLSEPWTPESGVTYYGYIVQSDGTVSAQVVVTQPAGEPYQVSAAWTGVAIANGYEVQQGSLYVIAPLTSLNAQDFTVVSRSKPDDKYNVTLELVNYDARVYELD